MFNWNFRLILLYQTKTTNISVMRKLSTSLLLLRTVAFFTSFILVITPWQLHAQKSNTRVPGEGLVHCGTMQEIERQLKADPNLKEKWRIEGERRYAEYLNSLNAGTPEEVNAGEIIIPVVFHIVGAAADVNAIPDRDAYEQVEILNRDFSGRKALGYAGLFPAGIASRVGQITNIKFVLARRTPAGALTSGIERRITTQTFTAGTVSQLKRFSTGGLDAWDTQKYLNVWCCSFTDGLLGIATFPFSTPPEEQGVTIGLYTIAGNTCRTYYPNYSEGATLGHEVGHYFYLYHTFGDNAACNDLDFRTQTGWPLPAPALIDDTPSEQGQAATIYGNPSGSFSDGCSPQPNGIAYGSFMNYYDDRALFMFTEGHKQRVIGTIDLYRAGFKTTNGAVPPVTVNDAYLVSMAPFGKCDTRSFALPGVPITATIRNFGTSTMTKVNITVSINGVLTQLPNVPLTLATGNDTTLVVATTPATAGLYLVQVYTTAPNGLTDNFLSNDSLRTFITVRSAGVTAPFTENFTSTTFPPTNWIINNPQSTTWTRSATAGFTAAGSATVQHYNYNGPGQLDELVTPPIDFGTFDSSRLSFKVAYSSYSNTVSDWDGLEVLISSDGGRNYTTAYKKTGHDLRTVAGLTTGNFNPLAVNPTRWRTEDINLTRFIIPGQRMLIKFRTTNAYGNNLYIDDIDVNAANLPRRDAIPQRFTNLPSQVCTGVSVAAPSVVVLNGGLDVLTTLNVNYRVDNGTVTTLPFTGSLIKGGTFTITLAGLNLSSFAPGVHTLTVYTSLPNGLADQNTANDTIRTNFTVFGKVTDPVVEGFEGTYPPAGWVISNPDAAITWSKTTLAAKTGTASAFMNNYNYATNGQKDVLQSPVITPIAQSDSLFLNFQLSATTYSYPGSTQIPLDTLEVLITTDCGTTFSTVYKKWGHELQTVSNPNNPNDPEFIPLTKNQWRFEKVDLTPYLTAGANGFQLFFRNTTNFENNIFVDDINIFSKQLPAKLKAQGYMISPNPFVNRFTIQHYLTPTDLKSVGVYNNLGQLVYKHNYNGNASSYIDVDMAKFAAGMYTVQLWYTNRVVTQKVIKLN
jgi:Pregnancy-associated plasma protein-A/Secretion system C-terminal sorting domain